MSKPFDEIIDFYGSGAALARALGIRRQTVHMWRGDVPEHRAYQIEVVSKGRFKAADILDRQRRHEAA